LGIISLWRYNITGIKLFSGDPFEVMIYALIIIIAPGTHPFP